MQKLVAASAVALGMALGAAGTALADHYDAASADRYLIVLKKNADLAALEAGIEASGGHLVRPLPQVGLAVAASAAPTFAEFMGQDGRVQSIALEPTYYLPDTLEIDAGSMTDQIPPRPPAPVDPPLNPDPDIDDLFAFGLIWGVERVGAPEAWAVTSRAGEFTGAGAVAAVIDTGIASNHPDLGENLIFNSCFTSAGDVVGRDYQDGDPCNPYPTVSDHGTHVAGTVAARFGGGRAVGVAPNAFLANYNIFERFPDGSVRAFTSSRWAAMIDAAERGYDVINMSLGFSASFGGQGTNELATFLAADKRVMDFVINEGTVVVASAGNDGTDNNGTFFHGPGDQPGALNVIATGIRPDPRFEAGVSTDVIAFFSNFGARANISAPGGDCGLDDNCSPAERPANWFEHLVLSAVVSEGVECAKTQSCPIGYGWKAGTSMAAPHVAGAVAITKAVNPALSGRQATNSLIKSADNLGDRQKFGHGMLNVLGAATAR